MVPAAEVSVTLPAAGQVLAQAPNAGLPNRLEITPMQKNVGTLDRALRIVAGLALIALAASGTIGPWGWIGAVPLATGLLSWCPAYTLLGIRSCKSV
jgi:hypothetical protein